MDSSQTFLTTLWYPNRNFWYTITFHRILLSKENYFPKNKPIQWLVDIKNASSLANGGSEKNMVLGARFQKLRREPYYQGGWILRTARENGKGGVIFSERARFSRATMFFCKHVIFVATLLLTIDINMYILISLV